MVTGTRRWTEREMWMLACLPAVLLAIAYAAFIAPRGRIVSQLETQHRETLRASPSPTSIAARRDELAAARTELDERTKTIEATREAASNESRRLDALRSPATTFAAWSRHLDEHGLFVTGTRTKGAGSDGAARSASLASHASRDLRVELDFAGSWTAARDALQSSNDVPGDWVPRALRMAEAETEAAWRRWTLVLRLPGSAQ